VASCNKCLYGSRKPSLEIDYAYTMHSAALSHGQFSVASFQSSRFLMSDSLLSSNIFEGFIVPFFLHVSVLSHYLDHGA
jgi:hypothetical protein